MWRMAAGFGVLVSLVPATAHATGDEYHVTDQEKAACTTDAIRFCMDTYPNERLLLACMKRNRARLSPVCSVAFDAGVKRRHL